MTDWKGIVGAVAPGIASALGGPLAGLAIGTLSERLLGKQDAGESELAAAIVGGGADTMLKLKDADNAFVVELSKLNIDLERINAADRASAREREIRTGDTATPRILAGLITLGFFGILAQMLLVGKPEHGGDALMILLGALGSAFLAVVNYFFGSSNGSAAKNEALLRMGAVK